jgi:ketosteroid isomerase-like protein
MLQLSDQAASSGVHSKMRNDLTRQVALSYLQAFHDGDVEKALTLCDDDIIMTVYAPVTLYPYLGHQRGKAAVGASMTTTLERYSSTRFEVVHMASENDTVAVMTLANFTKISNERVVSVHFAHFFTIRNNRIVEMRSFFDSFDAVQQFLELDLTDVLAAAIKDRP